MDFSLKIILQGDTSLHPCRGLVLWLTTEVVSDWHLIGLEDCHGIAVESISFSVETLRIVNIEDLFGT